MNTLNNDYNFIVTAKNRAYIPVDSATLSIRENSIDGKIIAQEKVSFTNYGEAKTVKFTTPFDSKDFHDGIKTYYFTLNADSVEDEYTGDNSEFVVVENPNHKEPFSASIISETIDDSNVLNTTITVKNNHNENRKGILKAIVYDKSQNKVISEVTKNLNIDALETITYDEKFALKEDLRDKYSIKLVLENDLPKTAVVLNELKLSSGNINPAFSPNVLNYTINLNDDVKIISITPTLSDDTALTKINEDIVLSGETSKEIKLENGKNIIKIQVVDRHGATKTYTITINGKPSGNTMLKSILINGKELKGFSYDKYDYTYEVSQFNTKIPTVEGIAENKNLTITYSQVGNLEQDGKALVKIEVLDKEGNKCVYNVNIVVSIFVKPISIPQSFVKNNEGVVKFNIQNNTELEKEATLIIGYFDKDNQLINCTTVNKKIAANSNVELEGKIIPIDEGEVRCFVWDSIDKMNPYSKVIKIPVITGENNNEIIHFPDANLEKVIRATIGKSTGDILKSDVANITKLRAESKNIASLEGIQYLDNLTQLQLFNNQISNIEPLRNLTKLTKLYLANNQITDYTPVSSYYKNLTDKDFTLP